MPLARLHGARKDRARGHCTGLTLTILGFIGLGAMGKPLAANLLGAGYRVRVFDRQSDAMTALASRGAETCRSAAEVAQGADFVVVCVSTDDQTREAILGEDGVLSGAGAGAAVIVNGTISPALVAEIAREAGRRRVAIVDAPMSGGVQGAEQKSLLYMIGGADTVVERCLPVLRVSARKIIHAGPTGAGVRAKLVHQLMLCGNLIAAREGWRLGQGAGLSPDVIADVVTSGAAQSAMAERLPTLPRDPHNAALWEKDLRLCLDLAQELALSLPATALAETLMRAVVMDE